MLRSSLALPPYAVEVVVTGIPDASNIPTIEILAANGLPKFDFIPSTCVGCSLGSTLHNPIALSASQDDATTLIWELDADNPSVLSLRYFSVNGGASSTTAEDDIVHINFPAQILPSITSYTTQHGCKVFVLTADGALNVINYVRVLPSGSESLANALSQGSGSIESIPLGPAFDKLGAPTCITCVADTVCIGTAQGHVLCISAAQPTVPSVFELNANAGLLGGLLGTIFNRSGPQPVEQLTEVRFMDRSFLCSIHSGAAMKLWDLDAQRMVHNCDLLPPDEAAAHKATIARVAVEPLDATCSILLVFFQPLDENSSDSGMLCTFELFLEDRAGSLKVLMEGGPRLAGGVHRLVDLAVQHIESHSIGAWMMYDDEYGRRKMHCVPLVFSDGAVKAAVEVRLVEEQIESTVPDATSMPQVGVLSSLASALEAALPDELRSADFHVTDIFADGIFAPGSLCRKSFAVAMEHLGWATDDVFSAEAIESADVAELKANLVSKVNNSASEYDEGILGAWIHVIECYTAAMRSRFAPLAIVQLCSHRDDEQGLLVMRTGGSLSMVRAAEAPELVASEAWPPSWSLLRSGDITDVKTVLQSAAAVVEASGGKPALAMIQACILRGADLHAHVLPAVLTWLQGGTGPSEWRMTCRRLPLSLGRLCSSVSMGFGSTLQSILSLLAQKHVPPSGQIRSKLRAFSQQIVTAAMVQAHQIAASQSDCLLRVALLTAYVSSQHVLGQWTVSDADRQVMMGLVGDQLRWAMTAAQVAYWSTALPTSYRSSDADSTDPSALVVTLRIGEGAPGASAPKRARLSPAYGGAGGDAAYPAEHLLTHFQVHAHAVRDIIDIQMVASSFANWLLCVQHVHDVDLRRHGGEAIIATRRALDMAPSLIKTASVTALDSLRSILGKREAEDARLVFLIASAMALKLKHSTSEEERRRLENDSAGLFFKAAVVFSLRIYFNEQINAVKIMLGSLSSHDGGTSLADPVLVEDGAAEAVAAAADELNYHETLMAVYERLGCPYAASRFALAAAKHVTAALPGDAHAEERVRRTGRLWSSVFTYRLKAGDYEEAYAALLGNEVAEMQTDCVHLLVNEMAEKGEIATLCSLPFAHTTLVVRGGNPAWVSLLDEAVLALKRRAENLDLSTRPQPYQVLFDFHASRGNFQSAAAAMLAYARRLAYENPDDRTAAEEMQKALAAAVATLSLVESDQAWLEDPWPKPRVLRSPAPAEPAVLGTPPIVTLADLKIEHALAVAKAAVAAVLPGGDLGTSRASDVFHQLLALKLFDEAFDLADAAFVGTKQQRMREIAIVALASHCAELQVHLGNSSSRQLGLVAADGDIDEGMLMDEAENGTNATGYGEPMQQDGLGSSHSAAVPGQPTVISAWKQLRGHLETYEKQSFNGYHLRVLAVDALLAVNNALNPPLWLLKPFFPASFGAGFSLGAASATLPSVDVAGLLRAYMKHDRIEDAGILAVKLLTPIADAVPSIALPRPAAVCLPHALLEELASRLPYDAPVRSDLNEKLDKTRAALQRQTRALADIYAA